MLKEIQDQILSSNWAPFAVLRYSYVRFWPQPKTANPKPSASTLLYAGRDAESMHQSSVTPSAQPIRHTILGGGRDLALLKIILKHRKS